MGKDGVADRCESRKNGIALNNRIKKHFEVIDAVVNNNKMKDDSEKKDLPRERFTSQKGGIKVKTPRVELKVERIIGETTKRLKIYVNKGTIVEKVNKNYAGKFELE